MKKLTRTFTACLCIFLSQTGSSPAQQTPGRDEFGKGHHFFVLEDFVQAETWFRRAAEKGNIISMSYLGLICRKGMGGRPVDMKEAVTWFRKAADQDEPLAMGYLAQIYREGAPSIERNSEEAERWEARQKAVKAAKGAVAKKSATAPFKKLKKETSSFQITASAPPTPPKPIINANLPYQGPNKLYGLMDRTGNVVVPAKYDFMSHFAKDGTATIRKGDKEGIIDNSGREIAPPIYRFTSAFSEGLATITKTDFHENRFRSLTAYINREGQEVIPFAKVHSEYYSFQDGLAVFTRNEKVGYIDQTAAEVIPPRFKAAELAGGNLLFAFTQGVAIVIIDDKGNRGLIDKNGNILTKKGYPVIRGNIQIFSQPKPWEGVFIFEMEDGTSGYLKKDGAELVPAGRYRHLREFSEGLAAVANHEGKWGFIDLNGSEAISIHFDQVRNFQNGYAGAESGGKWGYLNPTGKMVIEAKYRKVGDFNEGVAPVQIGARDYAFINEQGEICLILTNLDQFPGEFKEGFAVVKKGGAFGAINKKGEFVIEPKYQSFGFMGGWFEDGVIHAEVSKDQWIFVDATGKELRQK